MVSKKNKKNIRDLSHQMPSPGEFSRMIDGVDSWDGRAAALVLTALLDSFLEWSLRFTFVPLEPDEFNSLFRESPGHISSFASKIALAHALGIFNRLERKAADNVRHVRNAFAHATSDISFESSAIADFCTAMDPSVLIEGGEYQAETNTPRERFTITCLLLCTKLIRYNRKVASLAGVGEPAP
jgi:hypothetical protein